MPFSVLIARRSSACPVPSGDAPLPSRAELIAVELAGEMGKVGFAVRERPTLIVIARFETVSLVGREVRDEKSRIHQKGEAVEGAAGSSSPLDEKRG